MALFDRWHRSWLLDYLGRNTGDLLVGQAVDADGRRGWVTGEELQAGRSWSRLRRALVSWHVRWVLAEVDAIVATGRWEYREEGDEVVVRAPDEPSP